MEAMTDSEWREFVSAGTRTAKAAVTMADGGPHVTPIWFVLDGDDVLFNTGKQSVKGRALRYEPRVGLCVDDDRPPFSFVIIKGTATLVEELPEVRRWAAVIGGRYMGSDRAEEYGERNGVPTEYLVRVRITKVIAERDIAA